MMVASWLPLGRGTGSPSTFRVQSPESRYRQDRHPMPLAFGTGLFDFMTVDDHGLTSILCHFQEEVQIGFKATKNIEQLPNLPN